MLGKNYMFNHSEWLISTLQLIRFLSNAYIAYGWNSAVAKVVMHIADMVTEFYWLSPLSNYYATLALPFLAISLILFATLTHHYYGWIQPLRPTRAVLPWLSVLFFPVAIPHFKMIFPCFSFSAASYTTHPFYPTVVCWHGGYALYFVISLVVGISVTGLTYLNSMCFYNAEIPPAHPHLRDYAMNNRYTGMTDKHMVTVKSILLVLFISGHGASWRIALGVVACLLGAAATIHVVWLVPWWHDVLLTLYILQPLVLVWTGVVAVLTTVLEDAEGTGMLFFIMLPVLALAAHMLLRWRFITVADMPEKEITSAELALVKIHSIMRSFVQWVAQFGDIYVEDSAALAKVIEDTHLAIQAVVEMAVLRFPENADLHIFTAQYYMTQSAGRNRVLAWRSLTLAENAKNLHLDNRFRCRMLRTVLREATAAEQSVEVRDYIEFKTRRQVAESAVSQAMRTLVQFWTEVMQTRPDIDKLATTGESAHAQLNAVVRHFERLMQLNPHNVPVLRIYGVVCLEIFGDLGRAQQLFATADDVTNNKKKDMVSCDYGEFLRPIHLTPDIFDEENGIVAVSADAASMGMVENVNPAFLRMLGYNSQSDIVGKNIDVILPEPIRTHHNRYMEDYLVTRQSNVVNRTRMVMALHAAHGHLVPFAMYVRWSDEALGKMLGVLQPIINTYEVSAMVHPRNKVVTYATVNLSSVFGFSKRDVLAQRVSLWDILPAVRDDDNPDQISEDKLRQLLSTTGYECRGTHVVTRQHFNLHCYMMQIKVYEDAFYFLRCQVSQIQSSDDSDYVSEVESDLDEVEVIASVGSPKSLVPAAAVTAKFGSGSRTHTPRSPVASSRDSPLLHMHNIRLALAAGGKAGTVPGASSLTESSRTSAPSSARSTTSVASASSNASAKGQPCLLLDATESLPSASLVVPPSPADVEPSTPALFVPPAPIVSAVSPSQLVVPSPAPSPSSNYHGPYAGLYSSTDGEVDGSSRSTPDPVANALAQANGANMASDKVSTMSSTLLRRRKRQEMRRLKRAIDIDNTRTLTRLQWYRAAGILLICIAAGIILLDFLLSNSDVAHNMSLMENIYLSSVRQSYMLFAAVDTFIFQLMSRNSDTTEFAALFYRPAVMADDSWETVHNFFDEKAQHFVNNFQSVSFVVDSAPTNSAEREVLREQDTLATLQRDALSPTGWSVTNMSLKDCVLYFSAMINWSLYERKENTADDYGFFFAWANVGSRALQQGFDKDTELTLDEIMAREDYMYTVTLIIFLVALGSSVVIGALLMVPIIIQIEKSKARVLDIFLDVPHSVRKGLRRKAVRVYRLVEKVDNADRGMQGDDDDHDHDGEHTDGGSDATSLTQTTALTAATEDAYAAIFRRYNNQRAMEKDFSSGDESGSLHGEDVRREEEKQRAHKNRSGRVGTALGSGRAGPADDARSDAPKPVENGAMSVLSAFSGDTIISEADIQRREKSAHNVWTGGSMRVGVISFSIFLAIICVYYVIILILTSNYIVVSKDAVRRVAVGNARNPQLAYTITMAITHLFYNRQKLYAAEPLNPVAFLETTFSEAGLASVDRVSNSFSSVMYGGGVNNITSQFFDPEQVSLMFDSACTVNEETFYRLYPDARLLPHVLGTCTTTQNGILNRGLATAFDFMRDELLTLLQPEYSEAFSYLLTGDSSNIAYDLRVSLWTKLRGVYTLFEDQVYHFLMFSNALYLDTVVRQTDSFNVTRYILFGIWAGILFLCYFTLLYPTTVILARTCSQTNAMMLLLPAHVIRRIPAARLYIHENLSSE